MTVQSFKINFAPDLCKVVSSAVSKLLVIGKPGEALKIRDFFAYSLLVFD